MAVKWRLQSGSLLFSFIFRWLLSLLPWLTPCSFHAAVSHFQMDVFSLRWSIYLKFHPFPFIFLLLFPVLMWDCYSSFCMLNIIYLYIYSLAWPVSVVEPKCWYVTTISINPKDRNAKNTSMILPCLTFCILNFYLLNLEDISQTPLVLAEGRLSEEWITSCKTVILELVMIIFLIFYETPIEQCPYVQKFRWLFVTVGSWSRTWI